jgi:RNA-directed DNA polymerase
VASKAVSPRAEPAIHGRRQHEQPNTDRHDCSSRRGGSDSTVTRTCQATGEAFLVPERNRRSKVGRITGDAGKAAEDERVAAGSVVATKRSNVRGAKGPCHLRCLQHKEGKDEMTKASIDLQDLRRRLYVKAKAEPSWRFWGLYVHVCKMETLRAAYDMAKANDGAPGVDGVTFEAIEAQGADALLAQLRDELTGRTYQPLPARKQEIPKDGGKVRVLSIPAIRDRVVQGALKLILEPVFEADFQPGSYGYRPKRTAHDAIKRVAEAIVQRKTRVLDIDLRAYFDNVRHDRLLEKVARRVEDADIMHLLKTMLKASGKKGVPQGGVISPLLSNLYLNEVDKMLERAREVTRNGKYTHVEYARFADDLVVLIDAYKRHDWLIGAVTKRLREEFANLQVEINDEKSRTVDLERGESFSFLGFDFRYLRSLRGVMRPHYTPKLKKRTALLRELKEVFRRYRSQPIDRVISLINPKLRGWVNYFAVGHSSECLSYIKDWVEKKVRRHLAQARKRKGFCWKRWNRSWLYDTLRLFNGYRVRRDGLKAAPAG